MMYYRLKEPWAFRGWKKTPYAVQAQYGENKHKRPFFFQKEPFLDLLYFNGEEEVDPDTLSGDARQILREFLAQDMVEESPKPLPKLQALPRVCTGCPSSAASAVRLSPYHR